MNSAVSRVWWPSYYTALDTGNLVLDDLCCFRIPVITKNGAITNYSSKESSDIPAWTYDRVKKWLLRTLKYA